MNDFLDRVEKGKESKEEDYEMGNYLKEQGIDVLKPTPKKAEVPTFDADKVNRQIDYVKQGQRRAAIKNLPAEVVEKRAAEKATLLDKDADKTIEKAMFQDKGKGKSLLTEVKRIFDPTAGMDDTSAERDLIKDDYKSGAITKEEYTKQLKDLKEKASTFKQKAADAKNLLREGTGKFNYEKGISIADSSDRLKQWEDISKTDQLKFIASIEKGEPIPGTEKLYSDYKAQFDAVTILETALRWSNCWQVGISIFILILIYIN